MFLSVFDIITTGYYNYLTSRLTCIYVFIYPVSTFFRLSGIDWQVKAVDTPRGSSRYDRSLAASLILRGKDLTSADPSVFRDSSLFTPWMSPEMSFSVSMQPRAFCGYEKSAALISNSRSATRPLDHILEKAWNMFASRAYVHQYMRRGMSEEDFLDAFVTLEQVVSSYSTL